MERKYSGDVMKIYEGFNLSKEEAIRIVNEVLEILNDIGNDKLGLDEGIAKIRSMESDYAMYCFGFEIGRKIAISATKDVIEGIMGAKSS